MNATQACEIVRKAREEQKKIPNYRLGQAILNNIDDPVEYDKHKDLFYMIGDDDILYKFYSKIESYCS